jgi:hypothetical protein
MKTKLLLLIPGILISTIGFGQDSSRSNSKVIFNTAPKVRSSVIPATKSKTNSESQMYRPTRLGSSSAFYNTYEKNHYGAGAVTTNPHKSGSGVLENNQQSISPINNSDNTRDMRRDTRSGSSSPLYDTYKKNDYGAGAITTNPNKQGGSSPVIASPADSTYSAPDSTKKY